MLDIKELERIHMRASVAGDMLVSIAALGNAIDLMNQQQAEIERLKAALEAVKMEALNDNFQSLLTIAQLEERNKQQQPESPQESLKVRILRYLATVKESHYYQICHHVPSVNMDVIGEMEREGLIYHKQDKRNCYYISQITAAGRDYLASLEPAKAE